MTVKEMGNLLGLKKTGRYWLVHKNLFKTETKYGRMIVDDESFEQWYANQTRYHKINGEEPGKNLQSKKKKLNVSSNPDYLTRQEAALLGNVTEAMISYWWKKGRIPVEKAGTAVRIPRKEFELFLLSKETRKEG